jgi:uncharacterized protein YbcV (DUF1398 family)
MDDISVEIARDCLAAAESDRMAFPAIVGRLIDAGFEGYAIDFRRATATYYRPDGDSVVIDVPRRTTPIAAAFDAEAVQAAIREAQQNAPGYTYRGFCAKVMAAGCAGYVVSFSGRRALYMGRTAETHVELFPQ